MTRCSKRSIAALLLTALSCVDGVQAQSSELALALTAAPVHGGSTERLGGCVSHDPFVAFGGGVCYDGGWLPPGIAAPGTTPSTLGPNRCATPDPFVALGGGRCINGGWLPPGVPPPGPIACATPDPFVGLGGGTCANGGWLPPGHPLLPFSSHSR